MCVIDRKRAYTQPRLKPVPTSHQRHPWMQPVTFTAVPAGSQVTSGKFLSGPARTFTACVVMANCAQALNGSSRAAAIRHRHGARCVSRFVDVFMPPL
jgi:hypothetical protein